ncbi:MAG: hypothetical protein R2734_13500 [Nocardioides sp.]
MKREFRVEATVGKPQVALPRDHPRHGLEPPYTHKQPDGWLGPVRQGDHQHRAQRGPGDRRRRRMSSSTTSRGGRVPREYILSVDQGAQDAMEFGVLASLMVDVKVSSPRTAPTTTSTPPSWRSRSPAPVASRRPPARPAPCRRSRCSPWR